MVVLFPTHLQSLMTDLPLTWTLNLNVVSLQVSNVIGADVGVTGAGVDMDGAELTSSDGLDDKAIDGSLENDADGAELSSLDGLDDKTAEGALENDIDGAELNSSDGVAENAAVGALDSDTDGAVDTA